MRDNPEYRLYKAISTYMKLQYPRALYRFDYAGLNLSKAAAGQMKAIQCCRGYCDFELYEKRGNFNGLLIEIKPDGTKLFKKNSTYKTPHLQEQADMISMLIERDYRACFGVGFDNCVYIINSYMNLK